MDHWADPLNGRPAKRRLNVGSILPSSHLVGPVGVSWTSNYSATASANNATQATVAANGLKTVVDQRSLDIAARITPLEVDTKVANALLGLVAAVGLT